jgi:hypothetical protein
MSCRHLFKFLPLVLAALGGCVVIGSYPIDWPEKDGDLIGKCPKIAGTYSNAGVRHPPEAVPLSLAQIFGLPDGDRVFIEQSPRTISVAVAGPDGAVETVVFTSGEINLHGLTGWDVSRPRTFMCTVNVPDFQRRLFFSHLFKSAAGAPVPGVIGGSGDSVEFGKGTDGSLLLHFSKGWGALIALVPVGYSEQFRIKFPPAAP